MVVSEARGLPIRPARTVSRGHTGPAYPPGRPAAGGPLGRARVVPRLPRPSREMGPGIFPDVRWMPSDRASWLLPLVLGGLGVGLRLWQYAAGASLWADEANMALNIV